jgi:hypothetical protein
MGGSWSSFSPPSTAGSFSPETMLLLTDGSVLIHSAAGGSSNYSGSNQWIRLTPDSNGNYSTGTWSALLTMSNTRQFFSSAVLPDGRVYVIGGEYTNADSSGQDGSLGEIFDPQTNLWSPMSKPAAFSWIQGDASGAVLADGRVLLGNLQTTSPPFTTALWDPVTNDWTVAGSAFGTLGTDTKNSNCNEETWTLLPDGSVLTVDTLDEPNAERYIPSIDEWVSTGTTPSNLVLTTITDPTGASVSIFEIGPAILLPDGRVFAIGGTGQTALYTPPPAGSDPRTTPGTWTAGPAFPNDTSSGHVWPTLTASDAPAVLQTNGKVLLTAGNLYEINQGAANADYFSQDMTFLEFDPATNMLSTFSPVPFSPSSAPNTWPARFLLLPTGQILLTTQGSTIYIYTPDSADNDPQDSWRPAITSAPGTLVTGHTYTLTGTQFNGLSQAVSYGDDAQMATNYPIVRLSDAAGQVRYLRSFNFSTMAVATGDESVTTEIEVPLDVAPGQWQLAVIANGIASQPVDVEVAATDCYFILDRNTFGEGEIQALINLNGAPAVVSPALYVVVEGFTASDLGLTAANLANPPHQPSIPDPVSGLSAVFAGPVLPEDPSLPAGEVQRFTFPFSLQFAGTSVFAGAPETLAVSASFSVPSHPAPLTAQAEIELVANPDPFILHGDASAGYPWWLSTDLRVFQVAAGQTRFGATLAASGSAQQAATTFIQAVINNLNGDPAGAASVFDGVTQDETLSELTLLPANSSGTAVYNFALARIRLQDVAAAADVGVFFRMWQAQQATAQFDTSTLYRETTNPSGDVIPLLGIMGDEIITIPFFATPRIDTTSASMTTQTDPPNRQTIPADPLGAERDAYFGCWLDINQPGDLLFPDRMVGGNPADIPDGPFTGMGALLSIQQLVRSTHQCLLAEISYAPDPVTPGNDPSNSDKLAQRNLTLVGAPNPGVVTSRQVPQTFEIRPTAVPLAPGYRPDELMIDFSQVPASATADLYLPEASAADILTLAASMYATQRLSYIDANTVRMPCGGLTYVPVPGGLAPTFAGLLTVNLPATIRKGQQFNILLKQLASAGARKVIDTGETAAAESSLRTWRRVTGVFNLQIAVSTKQELLPAEERTLSVMRWIGQSIPVESRWYPVFQRYLGQLGGRVTGMGGNSGAIKPSPTGGIVLHRDPHAHGDVAEFTGKIEALIYDRFGDFAGFLLEETRDGHIAEFESRQPGIAALAGAAWEDGITVSVRASHADEHRPTSILFRREAGPL